MNYEHCLLRTLPHTVNLVENRSTPFEYIRERAIGGRLTTTLFLGFARDANRNLIIGYRGGSQIGR